MINIWRLKNFLKYRYIFSLVAILILGALLRFHHFAQRSLWLDEADSANLLKNDFVNIWPHLIVSGNNPTYIYLLKIWSEFFGNSEIALRTLSIFFGLISIIFIYKLGKLLFSRPVGTWAAFFLAINYFSIFYSIQARQYSLVILISIISYYYFSLLIIKKSNIKRIVLYIIFTLLGLYAHPWFFLLFGSQIFFIFLKYRFKVRPLIFYQALILLFSLPRIIQLFKLSESGASDWIGSTSFNTFFETFSFFTYGASMFYLVLIFIALFYIFIQVEKTEDRFFLKFKKDSFHSLNIGPSWLLINYLLLPIFMAFIVSKFTPFYEPGRYEAIVLPAFILIMANLFSEIKNYRVLIVGVVILIFLSFNSVITEAQTINNYQADDKKVAEDLLNFISNGDLVIYTDLSRPPFDYYLPRLNKNNKFFQEFSFPLGLSQHPAYQNINIQQSNKGDLDSDISFIMSRIAKEKPGNVWVVYNSFNPVANRLFEKFNKDYKLLGIYDFSQFSSPLHFQFILKYRSSD